MNASNANIPAPAKPNPEDHSLVVPAQPMTPVVSSPNQHLAPTLSAQQHVPQNGLTFGVHTALLNSQEFPPVPPKLTPQQASQTGSQMSFGKQNSEMTNQATVWVPPREKANQAPIVYSLESDEERSAKWCRQIDEFAFVVGNMHKDPVASKKLERLLLSDRFQRILRKYPSIEAKRSEDEANRLWYKLQNTQKNFKEVVKEMNKFEKEAMIFQKKCCACQEVAFRKNTQINGWSQKLQNCGNSIEQVSHATLVRYGQNLSGDKAEVSIPSLLVPQADSTRQISTGTSPDQDKNGGSPNMVPQHIGESIQKNSSEKTALSLGQQVLELLPAVNQSNGSMMASAPSQMIPAAQHIANVHVSPTPNKAGTKRKSAEKDISGMIPNKAKEFWRNQAAAIQAQHSDTNGVTAFHTQASHPVANGVQAQHIQPTPASMAQIGLLPGVTPPQEENSIFPFGWGSIFPQNMGFTGGPAPQQTIPMVPQMTPAMYQQNIGTNAPHSGIFAMPPQQTQPPLRFTPEQIIMAQQNLLKQLQDNPMMINYLLQQATPSHKEQLEQFLNIGSNAPGINMLNLHNK